MTETAHTPLPWAFEAGVEDNEGEFYVCHAGTVCTETTVCNPRNEADATLIVHAVNSHHRLVEALEVMRGYGCPVCNGDCGSANPPVMCCPMLMIDAALKEAGRG